MQENHELELSKESELKELNKKHEKEIEKHTDEIHLNTILISTL